MSSVVGLVNYLVEKNRFLKEGDILGTEEERFGTQEASVDL